jgi:two-component system, response regulator YesN
MPFQILLVDDDREFREELRECLSMYRVVEAASGEEAISIIKKPHAIDLVLLDVFMPGLSGTQVLREIKRISPSLSIIMLTGNSTKDLAIDALKGHADDYIEKPFDMETFFKTVQRTLMNKHKAVGTLQPYGKMERVRAYLENNYDKKVGLKDVADEVCLSPKYLSRLFKEKTGMGFNAYRLKVKIEVAQRFLKTTPVTVQEIADKLGYKNIESFVRIFKKITGETPTMHRTKGKKRRA